MAAFSSCRNSVFIKSTGASIHFPHLFSSPLVGVDAGEGEKENAPKIQRSLLRGASFWNDSFNTNAINGKSLINNEPRSGSLNQAVIELHGNLTGIKVF